MLPPSRVFEGPGSAGLAVQRVLLVLGAVLHQLEPVGVVAPVLPGDVVAVLALLAGQGDLRADVGGCHGVLLALSGRTARAVHVPAGIADTTTDPREGVRRDVAVTGFEPVTQRL